MGQLIARPTPHLGRPDQAGLDQMAQEALLELCRGEEDLRRVETGEEFLKKDRPFARSFGLLCRDERFQDLTCLPWLWKLPQGGVKMALQHSMNVP